MTTGKVRYNGQDLNLLGHPEITITRTPDPPLPAKADRWVHTITITQELNAEMPSTLWARTQRLEEIFNTTEGLLEILDENGPRIQIMVQVGANSIPQAIKNKESKWQVNLLGWTPIGQSPESQATYTPQSTPTPILLHHVRGHSETITTTRPNEFSANRSLTTTTTTFSARILSALPDLTALGKLNALRIKKKELEDLQGDQGTFTWGGQTDTIQITSITCKIADSCTHIDLQIQARKSTLPGNSEVEVNMTVETDEDDCGLGESRTNINGTIQAKTRDGAITKLNEIKADYQTSERTLKKTKISDTYLDGEDSDDSATWTGINFSLEYRNKPNLTFTRRTETSEDSNGCRATHSGEVKGSDLATALLKAQSLSESSDGLLISERLTIQEETACAIDGENAFDLYITSPDNPTFTGLYLKDPDTDLWQRRGPTTTYIQDPETEEYIPETTQRLFTLTTEGATWELRSDTEPGSDPITVTSTTLPTSPLDIAAWTISIAPFTPITLTLQSITAVRGEFITVSFSSEYTCTSSKLRGEFTVETDQSPFSDNSITASGSFTAPTQGEAETAARALIPAGVCITKDTITARTVQVETQTAWTVINFSFSWARAKTQTEIQWTEALATDYTSMTGTTTLSGTVHAATEFAAHLAIQELEDAMTLTLAIAPKSTSTTSGWKNVNATSKENLKSVSFSQTWSHGLTGEIAHDIIEARWSLARVGSVDNAIITPIACGDPVKQSGLGFTVGSLTSSGSIKSRILNTGVTWAHGKRSIASTITGVTTETGAEDPPQERAEVSYPEFQAADPSTFTFSFTYGFRYATATKGLWDITTLA
jgi:hypothetical protein